MLPLLKWDHLGEQFVLINFRVGKQSPGDVVRFNNLGANRKVAVEESTVDANRTEEGARFHHERRP